MNLATVSVGLFLLAARVAVGLTEIPWRSTSCPDASYHFCATVEFCDAPNGVFGFRLPGETGCAISTAPLIRLAPGKKYALTLANRAQTTGTKANLHTHGLHISGDGNSDDITRYANVDDCLTYTYHVSSSHMGGTFWYHAHVHEFTNEHVSGGAFGMLIVEEQSGIASNANVQLWLDRSHERLLVASKVVNKRLGNGVSSLQLPITAGEWYRLRVAAVDPSATPANFVVGGNACEVRAAAYDGVWRTSVPHPTNTNTYVLTGASRIDVAVKCLAGSHAVLWGGGQVATLITTVGTITAATPYANGGAWLPSRPLYLQDLRSATVGNTYDISMSAAQINGKRWDMNVPLATMQYDVVQEWTISGTGAHPFHLHIYHMQVVTQGGCGQHEEGEWYDTISDGSCTVRFRTIDYGGRVVFHCHVLSHEDNGAMGWVSVTGGPAADTAFLAPRTCPTSSPSLRSSTGRPSLRPSTGTPSLSPSTGKPILPTSNGKGNKP